ncbi:MAG: hypothetical protein A2283_18735 [Lentisphaerae bacterium RIFOXYA12_FULL_48_11]|nr:MAG: hypothetical protein A2283_18735 [Lentisphaerae bacterium RIFOXYA12_FULL_48_11]
MPCYYITTACKLLNNEAECINILTQISQNSEASRKATEKKVGRLPAVRFISFIFKMLFLAAIGYGLFKAYPFLKQWFFSMSTATK